jgi:large subunit ribosomal protein L4
MTSAQLVNLKGKNVGEVNLSDTVFGIEPNTGVLFEALQRQLANARAGTAKAKTRAEVSGGGRKPWRQKGTGRARAGSIRSPLWAGGGVAFGPQPRDYSKAMPKKVRRLALKSALAARKDELVVVKDFSELKEAKTKEFAVALKQLGIDDKKVLLVLDFACETCEKVERAARNIDLLKVVHVNDLNVKDLLECEAVLTTERTVEAINTRFTAEATKTEKPARKSKSDRKAKGEAKPKAEPKPKVKAAPAAKGKAQDAESAEPEKESKAKAPRKKVEEAEAETKPKAKKKAKETEE